MQRSIAFGIVCSALLGASGITGVACTGAGSALTTNTGPVVTGSGLKVTVAVASASLGDEGCGNVGAAGKAAAGQISADCARPLDGGSCSPLPCQETSVQLSFVADAAGSPAKVTITRVALLPAEDDTEIETLASGAPTSWNGTSYLSWDGTLKAADQVKASYPLASPKWSAIPSTTTTGRLAYSTQFRLRITVDIGGVTTTITSQKVSRAPQVAT
jgi:hypothetical protein